jgi:hypothetical protein
MAKELLLIVSFLISLVLYYITFSKINKLNVSKGTKAAFIYLTLLIPVLGYFIVQRHKKV